MVNVKVAADLPLPAHIYFIERDTAAFRGLMAKVSGNRRRRMVHK